MCVRFANAGTKKVRHREHGRQGFGSAVLCMLAVALGAAPAMSYVTTGHAVRKETTMTPNEAGSGPTMDAATKATLFREVPKKRAAGEPLDPALWNQFVAAQNDDLKTGPKVGEKVPDFTLPDQDGKPRPLRDLMGKDGLLLVFVRSADW
jgi:hypothetical protein